MKNLSKLKKKISIRTYTKADNTIVTSKITKSSFGTLVQYKCVRCNRFFRNLNLHDKTSRCGRVTDRTKITKSDMEMISKVGLDKAIKRNKK